MSGRQAMQFDLRIRSTGLRDACQAPDDIIVIDATGRTLPLIPPQDFVALLHGETTSDALMRARAADMASGAQTYPQMIRGTVRQTAPDTYAYTARSSPSGGFAGGLAASMQGLPAAIAAGQARQLEDQIQEQSARVLQPQRILPGAFIEGRVWSIAGEKPYAVNVFACGDRLEVLIPDEMGESRVHLPDEDAEIEAINAVIAAIPKLAEWQRHGCRQWEMAVRLDSQLLEQGEHDDLTHEERFRIVVEMVEDEMARMRIE